MADWSSITGGFSGPSGDRVRAFIRQGSNPESGANQSASSPMALRSGQPFPFVIAVIPSFNEEQSIERTVLSLREQSRPPDEIIVLADNCTDDTVIIALAIGVSVWQTRNNVGGKAGALNQLFAEFLTILDDDDSVLVMDADTVLTHRFIEATVNMLFDPSKKPIAGVGGIFLADDDCWSLVRQLQSNEYVRYQRRLSRRRGRALVLTGTGTVFRAGVLRHVMSARRSGQLPDLGEGRSVYDLSALTEDNELTLSVKELGYRVVSPRECTVKTAMMPTWESLFKQRRRWQRGALENLLAHGLNIRTVPYLLRQILTYVGVFFVPFYLFTLLVALVTRSELNFFEPLWVAVAVLYVVEQTFSVRKGGWRAVGVSLLVIPELALNTVLNVVYVVSFIGMLFGTDEQWGRVRHLREKPDGDLPPRRHPMNPDESTESQYGHHSETARHAVVRRKWRAFPSRRSSLHGTHPSRHTASARVVSVVIFLTIAVGFSLGIVLPLVDLQAAWSVIAVYVLIGAAATLGRLVPVKTF